MTDALTLIEPGIGQWRSADIDEDSLPTDLRFHEDPALSPLGAIFDARVSRVDTSLDMAFLELGSGLQGALNFRRARLLVNNKASSISDCVHEGQKLRVQVIAEPSSMDDKALAVSVRPRLTGRYVVVETGKARLSLSKDLTTKQSKAIKDVIGDITAPVAVIVRSSAAEVTADHVKAEVEHLISALTKPEGTLGPIFARSPAEKALLECDVSQSDIMVEGSEFAAVKTLAAANWPDLHVRLKPYKGRLPAFEKYGVNEAIDEALSEKIELPSGGWISIHPTPALTAIDVNMGSALQHMAAGEAKLVVNMEATLAIAYHLRFQDIGGLVVIDYINMTGKGHNRDLMKLIEKSFRSDRVPVQHSGISAFGLVELTRKRSGLSLRDRMQQQRTFGRSASTALDVLQKALHTGRSNTPGKLIIRVPEAIHTWLNAHEELVQQLTSEVHRETTVEKAENKLTDIYIRQPQVD